MKSLVLEIRSMYDFIYACIFYMVPRKAVLGRSQSAASLYSICLSLIYLIAFVWFVAYWPIQIDNKLLLGVVIILFIWNFIFNRMYFLKFAKQRLLLRKYEPWRKWKLKALGILFLIFSFAFFIAMSIIISLRKMWLSQLVRDCYGCFSLSNKGPARKISSAISKSAFFSYLIYNSFMSSIW